MSLTGTSQSNLTTPISIKTYLNPLDLDLFGIHLKLYSLTDTSHLNTADFVIKIHTLFSRKLTMMLKKDHISQFKDPFNYSDHHQKVNVGLFCPKNRTPSKFRGNMLRGFGVIMLTNQPNSKQTGAKTSRTPWWRKQLERKKINGFMQLLSCNPSLWVDLKNTLLTHFLKLKTSM